MHRHLDDILDERHVLPEIEVLEHHAEPAANALDLAAIGWHLAAMAVTDHFDIFAIDANDAAGGIFKEGN